MSETNDTFAHDDCCPICGYLNCACGYWLPPTWDPEEDEP